MLFLKLVVQIISLTLKRMVPTKKHTYGSSHPKVFLGKGVMKIFFKFTGEHPCRSVISIKLQSNFIEITLPHGCSPVNSLHIFRTPFLKNTSKRLLPIHTWKLQVCLNEYELLVETRRWRVKNKKKPEKI